MLEAKNIHKHYGNLHVLKGVSLALNAGEMVALVGASGAGKSTLLQILGTLDQPDEGEVLFDGERVSSWTEKAQAAFRNQKLGFIFQFHYLLPEFTALENVLMPAQIAGVSAAESESRAKSLLARLGLGERLAHRPSALSGGEQQRVAVARALINSPKLILADEPTGNLDSANSENLYTLFRQFTQELGVAFLITTHDEVLAAKADRILHIRDGRVL